MHRGEIPDGKNSVKKDEKPSNVIKAFKLGPKCHIHFAIGKTNVEELRYNYISYKYKHLPLLFVFLCRDFLMFEGIKDRLCQF